MQQACEYCTCYATSNTRRRTQAERSAETERRCSTQRCAWSPPAASAAVALRRRAVTVAATGDGPDSRGIVNHHFGSRRALLDALARDVQGRFAAPHVTARASSPRPRPRRRLPRRARGARSRRPAVFLVLWTEAIASDPDLRPVFAERDAAFRAAWRGAIRAGVADGSIAPTPIPGAAGGRARGAHARASGSSDCSSPDAVDLTAVRAEVRTRCWGGGSRRRLGSRPWRR